jgi:hypothetical protein
MASIELGQYCISLIDMTLSQRRWCSCKGKKKFLAVAIAQVECHCNNIQYGGKNVPYGVILGIPDNELWRNIAVG